MQGQIIYVEPGHAMGRLGPVVVMAFRREVRAEDFERFTAEVLGAQGPSVAMSVMSEEAPPGLSKPARVALTNTFEVVGDRMVAATVVIEGASLRSTIVRSMLSAVMIAARSRQPARVFGTREDAAAFVSTQVEVDGPLVGFASELFVAADAA